MPLTLIYAGTQHRLADDTDLETALALCTQIGDEPRKSVIREFALDDGDTLHAVVGPGVAIAVRETPTYAVLDSFG